MSVLWFPTLCVSLTLLLVPRVLEAGSSKAILRGTRIHGYVAAGGARIIDGEVAARGQFPYQAALFIDTASFCGGSLIAKDWVLTAAHCVAGLHFLVYLGAHEVTLGSEKGRTVRVVRSKRPHEQYDPKTLQNDLAVLQLSRPVDLAESSLVQVVRLPSRSQLQQLFENTTARVSGWGITQNDGTHIAPLLGFTDVTIISNEECVSKYSAEYIAPSTLCGRGEQHKNTCKGDSGGPLVVFGGAGDRIPTQVGVVSFGSDAGCDTGLPHGYARVTAFMAWISQSTGIPILD